MKFLYGHLRRSKSVKGFTLIELLVVISIIGLLSSVVLASVNSARARARDARRLSDVKQIQNALDLYALDHNGSYPQAQSGWWSSSNANWSNLQSALQPYFSALPSDPINNGWWAGATGNYDYGYYSNTWYGGSDTWYMIVFRLEGSNAQFKNSDGVKTCNGANATTFDYEANGGYGPNLVTWGRSCP